MKHILLTLSISLFSTYTYAQNIIHHTKEIGLYQTNQKTNFIKDSEMLSPKSADFIDNKLVINALEKGATIIYDINSWKKLPSIYHEFKKPQFEKIPNFPYTVNTQSFTGKPVEITHNKVKMWIPYYRLSWDQYSQAHSAIAQVDIASNTIEKLIPSGSIPKMVTLSHNGNTLVSTHWGDNTLGIYQLNAKYDIINYNHVVIDQQLNIKNIRGDRDKYCGSCLRGTVFTHDDKYILIGKMGGGGIAVVNAINNKYIGTIKNVPLTPRHLVLSKDGKTLFLSTCFSSEVAKIDMEKINISIEQLTNHQKVTLTLKDWNTSKLKSSVRTIALSHDNKYIYAAMNDTSEIGIIDVDTMKLIEKHKVSSFPVGLSVSDNDKYIAITSQGKSGKGGGNHIDIFERY